MSRSRPEVLQLLEIAREEYARLWTSVNGPELATSGHYEWMVQSVAGCTRTLEIGVGAGLSTVALLKQGHRVIGIDENPVCLIAAQTALRRAGFRAEVQLRGSSSGLSNSYVVDYVPVNAPARFPDVFLVEGNVLADDKLSDWLRTSGAYDAVLCWLAGGHRAIRRNTALPAPIRDGDAQFYGLCIHERAYDLAKQLLRPNGIVSFVDRMDKPIDVESEKRRLIDVHEALADDPSFEVESVSFRSYNDPYLVAAAGVKVTRPAVPASTPDGPRSALVCVTAKTRRHTG